MVGISKEAVVSLLTTTYSIATKMMISPDPTLSSNRSPATRGIRCDGPTRSDGMELVQVPLYARGNVYPRGANSGHNYGSHRGHPNMGNHQQRRDHNQYAHDPRKFDFITPLCCAPSWVSMWLQLTGYFYFQNNIHHHGRLIRRLSSYSPVGDHLVEYL